MRLPWRQPDPQVVVVYEEECPSCGRAILFLAGQKENSCGWCGSEVVRLGE